MRIELEQSTKLDMTPDEVRWLKGYLQNPFCHPDEEDPYDAKMRRKFFMSLAEIDNEQPRLSRSPIIVADKPY